MSEELGSLAVKIGIDSTGFQSGVSNINKSLKVLDSEFKANTAALGDNAKGLEGWKLKSEKLTKSMDLQRQKVNALEGAFNKSVDSKGRDAKATQDLEIKLNKAKTTLFNMETELSKTNKSIDTQSSKWTKLGTKFDTLGTKLKSVGSGLSNVGKTLTLSLTAPLAAAGAGALHAASDFEQGLSNIKAVSGATSEEMEQLKKLAIQMGIDTKYSATEAAKGIEELIKAGVSTKDILEGGLAGALSLATAGELALGDAAEISSTALNAFKNDNLSVKDAANMLAGAANASATSVGELKFGLSAVSAVASSVGLSFEDTSTALAVFAQNGLKGSDAGTSLKTMLMNLQPKTENQIMLFERLGLSAFNAQDAFSQLENLGFKPASESVIDLNKAATDYISSSLGLEKSSKKVQKEVQKFMDTFQSSAFYDANGQLKSMNEIAGLLQTSMKGMTDAQRISTMETMFGSDAIRAANILFKEGADGINNMKSAMGKVTSEQVAAEKMNNLKGKIEQLKGSLETLGIQLGSILIPIVSKIVNQLTIWTNEFMKLSPETQKVILTIAGVVAAIGPLLMIVGKVVSIGGTLSSLFGTLSGAMAATGGASAGLGGALAAITGPVGIAIAAIVALIAIFVALYKNNEDFRNNVNKTWNEIKTIISGVIDNLKELIQAFVKIAQDIWKKYGDQITKIISTAFDLISNIVKTALNVIKDTIKIVTSLIKGDWKGVWEGIKDLVSDVWNGIKIHIETLLKLIANIITTKLDIIKDFITTSWNNVKSITSTVWDGIKSAIETPINAAKDTVKGAIDAIFGFFSNLKLPEIKIPSIKLPHFSLEGSFSLAPPSVPSLGVDWYDKGGIFNSPSIIGVGEKRPEFVGALDDLRYLIRSELNNKTGNAKGITQTVNIYSPKAISPAETARHNKRVLQELALGF